METCRSCGEAVPAGTMDCPKCGTYIADSHEVALDGLMKMQKNKETESAEDEIIRLATVLLGARNIEKLKEFKKSVMHLPEKEQKKRLRHWLRERDHFDSSDSMFDTGSGFEPGEEDEEKLQWYCTNCGEWLTDSEKRIETKEEDPTKCPDCDTETLITREEFNKRLDELVA